ncbi:MAG: NADP-dependent malic enzyme [Actinomycetaceae bacterium]|nr:NADP-dependent malic enzyme [Actinomycetaceae bacterium]
MESTLPTSPSYTSSFELLIDERQGRLAKLLGEITATGARVKGLDVEESTSGRIKVHLNCDMINSSHREEVIAVLQNHRGVEMTNISDATFLAHRGGKIQIQAKYPIRNRDDLSRAYTPGVARVCQHIHKNPSRASSLTMKSNSVAVVTDGTAVLGLGDIGPAAALPVMEGKAVLFKQFGNVDAIPIALDAHEVDDIVAHIKAIAPGFGGINLEDISAPRCFEIEDRLRAELDIPVFHDDQHGTAIVALAGLTNALKVVGKKIENVRIVVSGVGAAGSAIIKLLLSQGASDIIAFGRSGPLIRTQTEGMHESRRWLAEHTNKKLFDGTLVEAIKDADVFIGVSTGGLLKNEDVAQMKNDAIVFALANPTPEIDPIFAAQHVGVVATGRSDFPNQINNVLAFPGLFRGILDAKISEITVELLRITALAIASVIDESELTPHYIIPGIFDQRVAGAVSRAVRKAVAAKERNAS